MRKKPYLITAKTKAIMNKESGYYRTLILEGREQRRSTYTCEEILNESCITYGADIVGRRKAAERYLKSSIKLPLSVHPAAGIYFFPTSSIQNKDCVWLAYHHIEEIKERDDKAFVLFEDGTGLYINSSVYTLDNQMKRTSELIVKLNKEFLFSGLLWMNHFR